MPQQLMQFNVKFLQIPIGVHVQFLLHNIWGGQQMYKNSKNNKLALMDGSLDGILVFFFIKS